MKIETLDNLLKEKNSTAFARVPDKKGQRDNNKVEIAFSGNGKVYTYKGSILGIAERLELIPEIWDDAEGKRIADNFFDGIIGYPQASDTARHWLFEQGKQPDGQWLDYKVVGQDEFGRDVAKFSFVDRGGW